MFQNYFRMNHFSSKTGQRVSILWKLRLDMFFSSAFGLVENNTFTYSHIVHPNLEERDHTLGNVLITQTLNVYSRVLSNIHFGFCLFPLLRLKKYPAQKDNTPKNTSWILVLFRFLIA